MSKQILLHDYYYYSCFKLELYKSLAKLYIPTDTGDALSGMNCPRTQTYLHLKISEVFCTHWCHFGFD